MGRTLRRDAERTPGARGAWALPQRRVLLRRATPHARRAPSMRTIFISRPSGWPMPPAAPMTHTLRSVEALRACAAAIGISFFTSADAMVAGWTLLTTT